MERIDAGRSLRRPHGAESRYGGNRAYYAQASDYIQLPPFETFRDAESHAATLAHELTHWTKHASRLDRSFDGQTLRR